MVLPSDSLTRWVVEAQERSADAYAEIVAETESQVLSRLRRYGFHAQDADDIAAATYLEAWTKLPRLRDPSRFRGWLMALLRGFASDARRRISLDRNRMSLLSEESLDEFESQGSPQESRQHLQEIVAILDKEDRILLEQKYLKRLTLREIASASGLKIHHVAHRLRRIKAELRTRWQLEVVGPEFDGELLAPHDTDGVVHA